MAKNWMHCGHAINNHDSNNYNVLIYCLSCSVTSFGLTMQHQRTNLENYDKWLVRHNNSTQVAITTATEQTGEIVIIIIID